MHFLVNASASLGADLESGRALSLRCDTISLQMQTLQEADPGLGRMKHEELHTCHSELGEGHPLQQRAEKLTGRMFEAEVEADGFAVVKLCQTPVLLPQVFIPHLSHNEEPQTWRRVLQWVSHCCEQ